MSPPFQPLQLLLAMFAGWVNRHQLDAIEYLQEENSVLTERLGGRRIRFTDAERCRLARKAHSLGRKVLNELHTLVTPDTRFWCIQGYFDHANAGRAAISLDYARAITHSSFRDQSRRRRPRPNENCPLRIR